MIIGDPASFAIESEMTEVFPEPGGWLALGSFVIHVSGRVCSVAERWLSADQYYGILSEWRDRFDEQWRRALG